MSVRPIVFGALLTALLLAPSAFADMGRVYFSAQGVKVSESAQKAIILHNNLEEVLILGTELSANQKTPIIRFIPFPSEPQVSLAPKGVFDRLAAIIAKYKLEYVIAHHTKGGRDSASSTGVEVRLNAKLGAHDLTIFKVRDAAAFRFWVNNYFHRKGLPRAKAYPKEEAIVADYVARGIDFFVLDVVELPNAKQYIYPVVYRFESKSLYYPLKTSNTFGGKGEIELFIVSPATLCIPGSNIFLDESDMAVGPQGNAAGSCLNQQFKASTSAKLVPEEHDLQAIYPDAETFFGNQPVFIQSMRYFGVYEFKDDVLLPLPQGTPKALRAGAESGGDIYSSLVEDIPAECRKKPDPGFCKGRFEAYYFDEQSHSCKPFFWGGCQGVVPFDTLEECEKSCKPRLPSGK